MRKIDLSEAQKEVIKTLYLEGKGRDDIARETGFPVTPIRRYLSEADFYVGKVRARRKKRHLSSDQRMRVCELFSSGTSIEKILEVTELSPAAVDRALKEEGLLCNGTKLLTDPQKEQVKTLYSKGIGADSISIATKLSGSAIKRFLREEGLKRNLIDASNASCQLRELKTNIDYFNEINTSDKAYWLGFIAADGNVNKAGRVLTIGLHSKDKEHLGKFASIFGVKVRDYIQKKSGGCDHDRPYSMVRVCSAQLIKDLNDHGILPRKSYLDIANSFLMTPDSLKWDFIRGIFDGDGCLGVSKIKEHLYLKVSISGVNSMMDAILSFMKRGGVESKSMVCSGESLSCLSLAGSPAVAAASHMYQNASLFLPRKKAIFDSYMNKHPQALAA